jgi:hypothetical protein
MGVVVFSESFETPVVSTYPDTNGFWLLYGPGASAGTGSSASRGLSFVGDSGLTWNVDAGNIDIVAVEWNAHDGIPGTGRICLIRSVVVRTLPIGGAVNAA